MTDATLPAAVRLRAMEPEDLDMLYRIENDELLWDVGTTNVPYSRYTLHDYIAHASADIYADHQVRLIIENGEGLTVGIADLVNFDPRHLRAEVGLVIEQPHRRHGYASAALRLLHRYATRTLHLHQLFAVVDSRNEAALSLFKGEGYEAKARLADWLFDGQHYREAILLQTMLR